MKITVRTPVQHDGVTYSEGRHDVDDDTAKAMISSGAATEGWTDDQGPLSQAGTQSPPGRSAPSGTTPSGTTPSGDGGDDTVGGPGTPRKTSSKGS